MRIRPLAAGVAGVAYLLASHWLMTRAPPSAWSPLAIAGPMLALAAALAWQRGQHLLATLAALATVALAWQAWQGGGLAPGSIYVAQHAAIHVLLGLLFGVTLLGGRESLITALARRVHGTLTPAMAAYSRKLTVTWTIYFLAMAALSLVLYALAPFATWAAFANLATPLAMLALFVGEYLVRYRLHPEFERATLAQALRAYADRAAPHE
jgi:uncharacterized membrane protein